MTRDILKKAIQITAIIQVVSAVVVLFFTWWRFGILDPFILGSAFSWVGIVILLIAVFFGVVGFFPRVKISKHFLCRGLGRWIGISRMFVGLARLG